MRGKDDDWVATWTLYAETTLDTPFNLTGYGAEFTVSKGDSILFQLAIGTDGGITLGGVSGTITFEKDLEGLPASTYDARLTLIDPEGNRRTFEAGIGEFVIL